MNLDEDYDNQRVAKIKERGVGLTCSNRVQTAFIDFIYPSNNLTNHTKLSKHEKTVCAFIRKRESRPQVEQRPLIQKEE